MHGGFIATARAGEERTSSAAFLFKEGKFLKVDDLSRQRNTLK
jgi:hypothetical protein